MLFASKSISKIATCAPTKASDKGEGQKQSKQEELSSSQKETKDTKVLVRKSLEVKKPPMVSQSLEVSLSVLFYISLHKKFHHTLCLVYSLTYTEFY